MEWKGEIGLREPSGLKTGRRRTMDEGSSVEARGKSKFVPVDYDEMPIFAIPRSGSGQSDGEPLGFRKIEEPGNERVLTTGLTVESHSLDHEDRRLTNDLKEDHIAAPRRANGRPLERSHPEGHGARFAEI